MTRDEQLAFIRRKCIEANREILYRHEIMCARDNCDHEIRLVDVLLAIENYPDYDEAVHGLLFSGPVDRRWNLHANDLTQQSGDCIAFLADLFQ